ncbi:DNA translocase FtsK [Bacillus luteolus]|uniref:DNA translocase FtsK n=1 Tax=Litchfieldia luteola TaxID=682179 RepID=A0ABR9QIH6_9BACI|nr:DNA translocase FtsK [Cytobacillus luteolus]MBE4908307.1 DNA translocase FtsK [Cytobacillus luteolus]MBP1943093.1 S-DNA-T family DNA segregation ATPase FtsK/SpoIIIE [Cytobacillus luteolus]
MDWLKKLYRTLVNDNEKITTEPEVTNNRVISPKNVEAKIAYQYPKGKFRFPLIPDEIKVTESLERRKSEIKKQDTNLTKLREVKVQEKKSGIKKQFKPTEVPSPVYGFGKPKKADTEDIIEFELVSSESMKQVQAEIAVTSSENNLNILESNLNEDLHALEENKVLEAEQEEKNLNESEEFLDLLKELRDGPLHNVHEDHKEDETAEIKSQSIVIEDEVDIEPTESAGHNLHHYSEVPSVEEKVTNETEQSIYENENPRRHYIPYNVMMLKQDRQNLQKKQLEKVQANEEVIPQSISLDDSEAAPQIETLNSVEEANEKDVETREPQSIGSYNFPSLQYLNLPVEQLEDDEEWLAEQSELLDQTLRNFKVGATVVNVTQGPAVTRFEVHPEPGVKVNKITNLADDIKLSLAAKDIRIEAPIPGKNTIGIEVPNRKSKSVLLREIIQSDAFNSDSSPMTVALGLDISGKPVVTDLRKMPHGLIAGATGSGKSVCINTMLVSLLYKASPHEVKLLLIDPKMVELAPYNHIPHLVSPVITDVKAATAALKWAVEEMERRYELFAHAGVRDIARFNELVDRHNEQSGHLPYLVIIIDELADLMMVAPGDVEEAICRIAQKARACGIHLILATQRPSVDVITGLIKANIPTRIAFSVSSQVDSRTIIDTNGADKLLGKGDMLFLENGSSKPTRIQGNFVSDDEIERVVQHVKDQMKPVYMFEQDELVKRATIQSEEDDLFYEACEFVLDQGGASTSSLQRRFRIGYNRAARLIDIMEEQGIISEGRGSKPREILITEDELENIQETSTSTL